MVIDEAIEKISSRAPPRLREQGARLLRSCRIEFPSAGPGEPIPVGRPGRNHRGHPPRESIRICFGIAGRPDDARQTKLTGYSLVFSPAGSYVIGRSSLHCAVRRFALGEISVVSRIGEAGRRHRSYTTCEPQVRIWPIFPFVRNHDLG